MANYLICDRCQHKNTVNSERTVFCKGCHKKLTNNYLDWKKSKFNSSFETYVDSLNDYNEGIPENHLRKDQTASPATNRKPIFKTSLSSPSKKTMIFLTSVFIQALLFIFILQSEPASITAVGRVSQTISTTSSYLDDVKWDTYPITQTLSITLPFELKESPSVLPSHMNYFIESLKSQRSESSNSFSITIENATFDPSFKSRNDHLIAVTDEYMKSPGVLPLKEEGLHTMIRDYNTYMEHGSYILNGKEYLYENYTLTKGKEGIKIILSYLKNDHLLRKYADIVTQSLLNNKHVI
ncbi:MAG: hypothetical protein HY062_10495 [Bacteroidetes bacterium]|nr:hypothetical protein [Bacteroidota bacterium]